VELNWSTFILEIINFLVLIWILKRFLYRPVMNLIAQRKAGIDKAGADAQTLRREAQALQEQYENRLAEWEREKEKARAQLHEELSAERAREMSRLRASLDEERAKARVLEERRRGESERKSEEVALAQAAQFASRLLSRAAGPELERRLVDLVAEDLSTLSENKQQRLRTAFAQAQEALTITSAYPLSETHRDRLTQVLAKVLAQNVFCEFIEDPKLMAGLRIVMGSWVLQANLQDELRFFAAMTSHDSAS
jgi:F-type H+-transporting ATPase subunit b